MPNCEISTESERAQLKIALLAQFFALNKNTPTENSHELKFTSNFQECSISKQKKRALQKALPTPSLRETVESRDLRNPSTKIYISDSPTATLNFFTARTPIYTVRRGELRKSGIRSCPYSRDRPDFSKIQKMIIFIRGK